MYYIVGKDSYDPSGKFIDTNDMNLYWELGWELMSNHILVKRWKKEGRIKEDDVIVTRTGGEFLYDTTFDNVINFTDFRKIKGFENHLDYFKNRLSNNSSEVYEVMLDGFKIQKNLFQNDKYHYFEEDRETITNMNFLDTNYLHNGKPYVCLNIRIRNWHTQLYRNVRDEYIINLLNILKKDFENIFIVGFNTDNFLDEQIKFVSMREYASLINNPLCKYVLGSMTGFNLLHQLISKAEQTITVDFGNENFNVLRFNPVGIGESLRYSKSIFKYFHYYDGIENVLFKKNSEL